MLNKGFIADVNGTLAGKGFSLLDDGGERHGAVEWTWSASRSKARGHAYVTLAAMAARFPGVQCEVWAGADDAQHFGRVPIAAFAVLALEGSMSTEWTTSIIDAVSHAAETAVALPNSLLTGERPYAATA